MNLSGIYILTVPQKAKRLTPSLEHKKPDSLMEKQSPFPGFRNRSPYRWETLKKMHHSCSFVAQITFWSAGAIVRRSPGNWRLPTGHSMQLASLYLCLCHWAYTQKMKASALWQKNGVVWVAGAKSITIKKVFLKRPWKLCLRSLSTKMTSKLWGLNVMASASVEGVVRQGRWSTGACKVPHMFSCRRKLTLDRFLGQPLATLLHNRVQNSLDWIKRLPRRLWIEGCEDWEYTAPEQPSSFKA